MFRNSRQVGPSAQASELGRLLVPLPIFFWGPLAMYHLGVPIGGGVSPLCWLLFLPYQLINLVLYVC